MPITARSLRILLLSIVCMLSATAPAAERAIDKQVVVEAPIAEVWKNWTTREGIESFFAPEAVVDARVGGAFFIHIDPLARPGNKGADDMRFMALQEPTMLSFDWNAPPSLPQARQQRTFVIVRLTSLEPGKTRVDLHHTGWGSGGEWDKSFAYFDTSWGNVLANLQKRFKAGPMDWSEWLAMLRKYHAESSKAPAR